MTHLIPALDWHQIMVAPWSDNGAIYIWVVLMGFLVTAACGLIGNYLILRRMALVGDAISHSVLPGLAIAFLAVAALSPAESGAALDPGHHDFRQPTLMFLGALAAGVLTTVIIEFIHKKSRIKQDAAIGITFSTLFAVGVILISLFADRIDLDQECVLYGEITFVPLEPFVTWGEFEIAPPSVMRMGLVATATAALIFIFYKELLVSSFDPALAAAIGINATLVHYGLMCWLSVVVVSAFESVGAILVIAMLIFPGATAGLLSRRFPTILLLSLFHAALSSILGLHLSIWLECSTAGAMVVAAAILFLLAWTFSPLDGLLSLQRLFRKVDPPGTSASIHNTMINAKR